MVGQCTINVLFRYTIWTNTHTIYFNRSVLFATHSFAQFLLCAKAICVFGYYCWISANIDAKCLREHSLIETSLLQWIFYLVAHMEPLLYLPTSVSTFLFFYLHLSIFETQIITSLVTIFVQCHTVGCSENEQFPEISINVVETLYSSSPALIRRFRPIQRHIQWNEFVHRLRIYSKKRKILESEKYIYHALLILYHKKLFFTILLYVRTYTYTTNKNLHTVTNKKLYEQQTLNQVYTLVTIFEAWKITKIGNFVTTNIRICDFIIKGKFEFNTTQELESCLGALHSSFVRL